MVATLSAGKSTAMFAKCFEGWGDLVLQTFICCEIVTTHVFWEHVRLGSYRSLSGRCCEQWDSGFLHLYLNIFSLKYFYDVSAHHRRSDMDSACLFHLRQSNNSYRKNLLHRSRENILAMNLTSWFRNSSAQDRKAQCRVIQAAESTMGSALPSLQDIHS